MAKLRLSLHEHSVIILYHSSLYLSLFFFFNDTATTEIYTLSLHDALPISPIRAVRVREMFDWFDRRCLAVPEIQREFVWNAQRSEEHTSELQSRRDLVCRLLLEKKKKQ